MDAPALGMLHGLAGAVDVGGVARARPATIAFCTRSAIARDGLEVALGGDREAGLDDVDAHAVEALGDLQLLVERHGGAGGLLAVAQRGVEDEDAVGVRCPSLLLGSAVIGCFFRSGLLMKEPR